MVQLPTIEAQPTRRPRAVPVFSWCLSAAGLVCVGLSYAAATGLFDPGCGSPFLFRYIGVNGDPMATHFYNCLLAAPGYRSLAFVLAAVGLGLLVAGAITTRTLATPLARVVRWVSVAVAACAGLLLLGGSLAVAQVVS